MDGLDLLLPAALGVLGGLAGTTLRTVISARGTFDGRLGEQQARLSAAHAMIINNDRNAQLFATALVSPDQISEMTSADLVRIFYILAARFGHYETLVLQRGRTDRDEWLSSLTDFSSQTVFWVYWTCDQATYDEDFQKMMKGVFVKQELPVVEAGDEPPVIRFVRTLQGNAGSPNRPGEGPEVSADSD